MRCDPIVAITNISVHIQPARDDYRCQDRHSGQAGTLHASLHRCPERRAAAREDHWSGEYLALSSSLPSATGTTATLTLKALTDVSHCRLILRQRLVLLPWLGPLAPLAPLAPSGPLELLEPPQRPLDTRLQHLPPLLLPPRLRPAQRLLFLWETAFPRRSLLSSRPPTPFPTMMRLAMSHCSL